MLGNEARMDVAFLEIFVTRQVDQEVDVCLESRYLLKIKIKICKNLAKTLSDFLTHVILR